MLQLEQRASIQAMEKEVMLLTSWLIPPSMSSAPKSAQLIARSLSSVQETSNILAAKTYIGTSCAGPKTLKPSTSSAPAACK